MKNDLRTELSSDIARAKTLTKVLGQSEHVKDLVEECGEELSTVNLDLKQELADRDPLPGVEIALEKSEDVADKVQVASDELAVVNLALELEISERHALEQQLADVTEEKDAARHAALHDELTGLPNRVLFNDRLEHGLALATRHGWNLAVMFVDLDKFKEVNDSFGHDVGDCVLQTIATRLNLHTRRADTMSRLGGDEFLYLLMETGDVRDVTLIAEKIIQSIEAPCEVSSGGITVSPIVKASIGISIFPRDGTTAEALIKCADTAMYQAKQDQTGYAFAQ